MSVYAQRLVEIASRYWRDEKWCWELISEAWKVHLITLEEVWAIWDVVFGGSGHVAQHKTSI